MRADFSRLTFDRLESYKKHYVAVLHQQGRVWLDADWNEDVLARLRLLQQETQDIIGTCGTPEDPGTAFAISRNDNEPKNFLIAAKLPDKSDWSGHYYVNGILAELEEPTKFLDQPDLPGAQLPFSPDELKDGEEKLALVYLEVWLRLITYVEDNTLREIALGGPDTAVRLKTVAQVRVVPVPNDVEKNCEDFLPKDGNGTLTVAATSKAPEVGDPCRLPDEGTYSGRENRLYRVEIHEGGDVRGVVSSPTVIGLKSNAAIGATTVVLNRVLTSEEGEAALRGSNIVSLGDDDGISESVTVTKVDGETITLSTKLVKAFDIAKHSVLKIEIKVAQFKWSRDNAAFAVGVTHVKEEDRKTVSLTSLGRDQATTLRAGDVVEISDDLHELGPNHGSLHTLVKDPDLDGLTVELAPALPDEFPIDKADGHPIRPMILRRWDGVGLASNVFDPLKTPDMDLGDGIHINFGGSDLRAGDYWTFAARSSDGSVEPVSDRDGIRRKRCPLALVRWSKRPALDQARVLAILRKVDDPFLTAEQLDSVKKALEKLPNHLGKAAILGLAKRSGAPQDKLAALEKAVDQELAALPADNLQFDVIHDCRKKFPALTAVETTWPFMRYVGGDGQESKLDGTLDQELRVAVFKGSNPFDATVKFKIRDGDGGTLKGGGHTGSEVDVATSAGIATCKWTLAVHESGKPPPPRMQQVEATLIAVPNQEAPIRFNASLSLDRFCYVGGDGQEAGKDNKLPKPLQVAVFNGYEPVQKRKVQFAILQDRGGELVGVDEKGNPLVDDSGNQVKGRVIKVETDANGLAHCVWTLDPKPLGTAQTVEARLLQGNEKEYLQPIHFNASIDREDGIRITRIAIGESEGKRELVNDQSLAPKLLDRGIDFFIDPVSDPAAIEIISKATCFLTVEVPISALFRAEQQPVPMPYLPVIIDADVKLVDNRIHWKPKEKTGTLIENWLKAPGRDDLIARVTILGNFVFNKKLNLYLDGDSFTSAEKKNKLTIGDGRAGGDFRMLLKLQQSELKLIGDVPKFDPIVAGAHGENPKPLTLTSPKAQRLHLSIVGSGAAKPFKVDPTETLDIQAGTPTTIQIQFVPAVENVGTFASTLLIEGATDLDFLEVPLSGTATPPA
ncbi:MAG TPA: DUF6519 domain-containing protein [Gemmataceae bacterium]|jgi:hypothetical protein|nr:DUF6519 domain-containing protein [Gemmataceae bacterium]